MRDINRIDKFTSELNRIWKTYFPDWRFGQLMSNMLGQYVVDTKRDIFFPEENELLNYMYYYCGEKKSWKL